MDVELWTEPVFLEVEAEEDEGSKQGHQGDQRTREGPQGAERPEILPVSQW